MSFHISNLRFCFCLAITKRAGGWMAVLKIGALGHFRVAAFWCSGGVFENDQN
jgi:hypothetical protein